MGVLYHNVPGEKCAAVCIIICTDRGNFSQKTSAYRDGAVRRSPGTGQTKNERNMCMKKCNWKCWVKCAGIRALKTVAQTAVATMGTSAVLAEVNWTLVASASALAGIMSLLTSLGGIPEVSKTDDSSDA